MQEGNGKHIHEKLNMIIISHKNPLKGNRRYSEGTINPCNKLPKDNISENEKKYRKQI